MTAWRLFIPASLLLLGLCACTEAELSRVGKQLLQDVAQPATASATPTSREIGLGLKEALRVGSERVVVQLGRIDGFNADPAIHVPLPKDLEKARGKLAKIGLDGLLKDLELRLNRAAEAATPKARVLFLDAIEEMTLDDVMSIYRGPDDAATRYFKGKMDKGLTEAMRPLVDDSLAEVGAIQSYNKLMENYRRIPFAPAIHTDLSGYVVGKGMDGIFHQLAREEAAIRRDPAKRTTELLRRVFAAY